MHDGTEIWGIGSSYSESDAEAISKYHLFESEKASTIDFIDEWMSLTPDTK